jgi:hypothetical protein
MYKEFEQEANDCADLTIIELALFSQTCTLNSQTNRSKFCDAYLFARFAQVMQVLADGPDDGKSLQNYPSAREKEVILRNFTCVRRHHPMADVLN